jgi:hypothetical protein
MNPEKPTESQRPAPQGSNTDSFDVPVKKSPLFLFALLQIPILILMVLMIWFMYQTQSS